LQQEINTVEKLMNSVRFKKATNNRQYTTEELLEIGKLYKHIKTNNLHLSYNLFIAIVSYDLTDTISRYSKLLGKLNRTNETYILRYGTEEGNIRWQQYCEKQRVKNLFETKQQKYGWSKEEFKNFNKSRAVTLELCIKRHGEEQGTLLWEKYTNRQAYTNSLEYYIEKFNSYEDGYIKWIEYNSEKSKSSNIDWIMQKYKVDKNGAEDILSNRRNTSFSSLAEKSFVDLFEKSLGTQIKYSVNTSQFCVWSHDLDQPCFYDIADTKSMKIIEFNGDYWHCNPLQYSSDYVVKQNGLSAKQIWKNDYLKIKAATDRGFSVKLVWWSDFEKQPDQVIEESVRWWNTK
jgi:hypothetical protein